MKLKDFQADTWQPPLVFLGKWRGKENGDRGLKLVSHRAAQRWVRGTGTALVPQNLISAAQSSPLSDFLEEKLVLSESCPTRSIPGEGSGRVPHGPMPARKAVAWMDHVSRSSSTSDLSGFRHRQQLPCPTVPTAWSSSQHSPGITHQPPSIASTNLVQSVPINPASVSPHVISSSPTYLQPLCYPPPSTGAW